MTSVDSDEPVQPPFKLRTSKCYFVGSLILIEYSKQLAKALIRLQVCWSHIPQCGISHVAAHLCLSGDVTVDELMTRLIQDHEVFAEQQQNDIEQEVKFHLIKRHL